MSLTEKSVAALRADAVRNRERIVAAADEVFAERGLDASTAEIAERAGVGEATIYRRFATKDELVEAIVATKMDEAQAIAEECLGDADAWRGLRRFLTEMVERSIRDQGVHDAAKDRCMAAPTMAPRLKRMLDSCAALVRRAQEQGTVRADVAGQDLFFIVGAVGSLSRFPYPDLREDVWKRYLGLLLDGLRPEGSTKLRPGAPARRLLELQAPVSPSK